MAGAILVFQNATRGISIEIDQKAVTFSACSNRHLGQPNQLSFLKEEIGACRHDVIAT